MTTKSTRAAKAQSRKRASSPPHMYPSAEAMEIATRVNALPAAAQKEIARVVSEQADPDREQKLEDAVCMLESGLFGLTSCGSHVTDDGHDIAPYVRTLELALIKLRRHVIPYEEAQS